jgi:insulysin
VEQIKQTTKQEIINVFMRYIHPSSTTRRKLSIHMDSQVKPAEDLTARAKKLMEALVGKDVVVPEDELKALLATNPDVPAVQAFARECITKSSVNEDLPALDALVSALAEPSKETTATVRESNVFVEDIVGWKASLQASAAARPVEALVVKA